MAGMITYWNQMCENGIEINDYGNENVVCR
jgi:hypothetical protein